METIEEVARFFEQPSSVNVKLKDGGTFWVQDQLLCGLSSYFRAALQGKFEESRTKTLALPGCSTDTFKQLLFWIINHEVDYTDLDEEYDSSEAQVRLVNLWIAGETYLLPKLQNQVVKALIHAFDFSNARYGGISAAFNLAAADSGLRALFVDQLLRDRRCHDDYDQDEMDRIGSIPGFISACLAKAFEWIDDNGSRNGLDALDYMVKEQ